MGDALALLEMSGIAAGYFVLDKMVKHSPVQVLEANLVEPGKFLILFSGGVAEVEEAHRAVHLERPDDVVQDILLPFAHPLVLSAVSGRELHRSSEEYDCLGVVETQQIAGALLGADRSLKDAGVSLVGLRLTGGLGGRAFYVICGPQHDVETALIVSEEVLTEKGGVFRKEIITRPHQDMVEWVLRPLPFHLKGGANGIS